MNGRQGRDLERRSTLEQTLSAPARELITHRHHVRKSRYAPAHARPRRFRRTNARWVNGGNYTVAPDKRRIPTIHAVT
jgi:hypothetical protein